MTKAEKLQQIENLKKIGLDDTEIQDVIKCDYEIDHGAKLFELPKELKQGSDLARKVGNTAGYTWKNGREKKVDNTKSRIIKKLSAVVGQAVTITNPEREFVFTENGRKFKVTLSCPRT